MFGIKRLLKTKPKPKYPPANTKKRIPAKSGYRKDCKRFFKSKMEANYYRFCTQILDKVYCEYEPEVFWFPKNASNQGIQYYCPDFKITTKAGVHYVETKGLMDAPSVEKIRLFREFYPGLKLLIVGNKAYQNIYKCYGKRIKGWE